MLSGDWHKAEMSDTYELRLGKAFTATIKQRGGASIYAKCWIVTLNQDLLTETNDPEFAKGRAEWEIITQLDTLKDAYRRIKQRAPTSSDLFPDGAFYRWKVSRMVKPGRIDLSALKTDTEA
jgi:hypothetical protein